MNPVTFSQKKYMSQPPFNGVAPRITANDVNKYRGRYVTMVTEATEFNTPLVTKDVITGKDVVIHNLADEGQLARINEFFLFVDSTSGDLLYHSNGTMPDDFDAKSYAKLVEFMGNGYGNMFGM